METEHLSKSTLAAKLGADFLNLFWCAILRAIVKLTQYHDSGTE